MCVKYGKIAEPYTSENQTEYAKDVIKRVLKDIFIF